MTDDELEILELREAWWLNHGCEQDALYQENGELLCKRCLTDFKRLDPEALRARMALVNARNQTAMVEAENLIRSLESKVNELKGEK